MTKLISSEHGIVCRLPGERFGYFGWPTGARMEGGTLLVVSSGLRSEHILAEGSLFTVCYQKVAGDAKCSLLWSRWALP